MAESSDTAFQSRRQPGLPNAPVGDDRPPRRAAAALLGAGPGSGDAECTKLLAHFPNRL